MGKDPSLSIQVLLNDETEIESHRVPSGSEDFVSLKLGGQVSVLLFNSNQAITLAKAAVDANRILKTIELEIEEAELISAWDDDDEYLNCTIENPCSDCQESTSTNGWGIFQTLEYTL